MQQSYIFFRFFQNYSAQKEKVLKDFNDLKDPKTPNS